MIALAALLTGRAASANTVAIDLVSFGVGAHARPADWTAIRVGLTSALAEPVQVEVQWEIENADGDIGEYVRSVALSPGQRVERWLYGKLPPSSIAADIVGNRPYAIRVFEVADGVRVRELASTRISGDTARTPTAPVELDQDLFLVVGDRRLGLEAYGLRPNNFSVLPSLATVGRVATGLQVEDLPDQWQGLLSASAIVWADAGRSPARLTGDQAEAILEWVRRGGTLVLAIPTESQDIWGLGRTGVHPLEPILPRAAPRRVAAVPVAELLPILSTQRTLQRADATTTIAVFDASSLEPGWQPFVALPSPKAPATGFLVPRPETLDGAVVGIRRSFGHGHVVLLGLDLDALNGRMLLTQALPRADVFWNRVLGRRGDTPSLEEVAQLIDQTPPKIATSFGNVSNMGDGALIATQIGLTGQAALGVLAAAGLFAAFWLLSGPLGFAVLRQFRQERHSWVLFVLVALLFTAVAWAGGRLLGSTRASLRHVTFLDQIALDPAQSEGFTAPPARALSYFSVSLPGYGPTRLAIGHGDERRGNLLASWAPPPSGSGDTFPNKDRFRVELSSPDDYRVPARATSGDFMAHWRGSIDPRWGSVVSVQSPVQLQIDRTDPRTQLQLVGSLVHGFPGPLRELTVIVVTPFRTPLQTLIAGTDPIPALNSRGELPLRALAVRRAEWKPGEPLDLSAAFGRRSPTGAGPRTDGQRSDGNVGLRQFLRERYYASIARAFGGLGQLTTTLNEETRRRYMEMLSLHAMLEPPEWIVMGSQQPEIARALRMLAREADLSPWLTRPCVIVMGFLDEAPSPVPISVEGETIAGVGTTVYRWIHPLDWPLDLAVPDLPSGADAEEREPEERADADPLDAPATVPAPGRRPSGQPPAAIPGRPAPR